MRPRRAGFADGHEVLVLFVEFAEFVFEHGEKPCLDGIPQLTESRQSAHSGILLWVWLDTSRGYATTHGSTYPLQKPYLTTIPRNNGGGGAKKALDKICPADYSWEHTGAKASPLVGFCKRLSQQAKPLPCVGFCKWLVPQNAYGVPR